MLTGGDFPKYRGRMEYVCLGCGQRYDIRELFYTCPKCSGVFVLEDTTFDSLAEFPPSYWQSLSISGPPPGPRPCAASSATTS